MIKLFHIQSGSSVFVFFFFSFLVDVYFSIDVLSMQSGVCMFSMQLYFSFVRTLYHFGLGQEFSRYLLLLFYLYFSGGMRDNHKLSAEYTMELKSLG